MLFVIDKILGMEERQIVRLFNNTTLVVSSTIYKPFRSRVRASAPDVVCCVTLFCPEREMERGLYHYSPPFHLPTKRTT